MTMNDIHRVTPVDPFQDRRAGLAPGEVPVMTYTQPGMPVTTIEVPAYADKKFYDGMMPEFCTESLAQNASQEDDLDNAYELLELEDDAGEKEIKTAYRKISLKCHPDRSLDGRERHAQEDAKRRKLREDLEGRESMANARSQAYRRAQEDAEARKKYLQQDMAQRIKAKEEELARKQQEAPV
eukprot:g15647.t1